MMTATPKALARRSISLHLIGSIAADVVSFRAERAIFPVAWAAIHGLPTPSDAHANLAWCLCWGP